MVFPTPFVPFPSGDDYGPPLSFEDALKILVPTFLILGGLLVLIGIARFIIGVIKK